MNHNTIKKWTTLLFFASVTSFLHLRDEQHHTADRTAFEWKPHCIEWASELHNLFCWTFFFSYTSEQHHSQKWTTFEDRRHCKCWCSRLNSDTHGNIFATLGFLLHSNRRVSCIQHKITLLQTKNRTAYKGQASCMDSFILFIKKWTRMDRIDDGRWTPTLLKVIHNTLESEPHYFVLLV